MASLEVREVWWEVRVPVSRSRLVRSRAEVTDRDQRLTDFRLEREQLLGCFSFLAHRLVASSFQASNLGQELGRLLLMLEL